MRILLGIEGGKGKNLAATGAVALAAQEHQVDVITAHPDIWEGNPNVQRVWDWNRAEYLADSLSVYDEVIFEDAYKNTKFLLDGCDITCAYNYMLNGMCQPVTPQVYLTKSEYLHVESMLAGIEKPILAVQTNGGYNEGYAWNRDLPLDQAVEVLNSFIEDYEIIHLRAQGQLEIEGIKHTADLSLRQSLVVLAKSSKRLLVDSVYQHAAAAMGLESVVCWVSTESIKFGYDIHTNIQANKPELKNTNRLEGFLKGLNSEPSFCPFSPTQDIFDTKKIIDALKQPIVIE